MGARMKPVTPRGYQIVDINGDTHWINEHRPRRRHRLLWTLFIAFVITSALAVGAATVLPATQSSSGVPLEQYTVRTLTPTTVVRATSAQQARDQLDATIPSCMTPKGTR